MKSNVSDHLELLEVVYIDATSKCIADVSDLRDLMTIRSRVKDEGLSFLTITLPRFCSDFERSLAIGYVDSTLFRNFRKNGSIPAFLQGMTSLIFDRETGRINDEYTKCNSSDACTVVESIRQICLTFKKLLVDCTPTREAAALENFITVEHSFEMFSLSNQETAIFEQVSEVLYTNSINTICIDELVLRHGPGHTADHVSGNRKYAWRHWHERLEPYFPLIGGAYPIGICDSLDSEEFLSVNVVPAELEEPVRVITVPKTLKGPRIIALEPCCMQYAQQGVKDALYRALETGYYTKGHINFSDQSVNQSLAMRSSIDGQHATIDLSDASDRVPRSLALRMFQSHPDLRDAIDACRSTRAKMPDGTIIGPLRKFASMGSALCFPIEAMYFYTICVVARLGFHNLPVTPRNIYFVSREIYVYGDDIIVPVDEAVTVLDYLQRYNCKVNTEKTFWSGSFRESCGVDAFNGTQVTPVYLRREYPKDRREASNIISWVSTANAFYKKGYWHVTQLMFNKLEKLIGNIPYVSETSGGLGRISFLGYRSVGRWNGGLQRFEVKTLVPRPVHRTDELENYGALNKCFLKLDNLKNYPVSRDALHLERSALHHAVALKRGWVPAT